MRYIRGLHNLPIDNTAYAVTIGNFDGVHLGHQHVIKQLQHAAKLRSLPALLVTFEPHPQEFLYRETPPARLSNFAEKLQALAFYQVETVLGLRFNSKLATLTADEFIQQVLVSLLKVKYLLVGDDFCFGHQRQGDFSLLQQAGETYGFNVEQMPTQQRNGERVSSTQIRHVLATGDMDLAAKYLNRSYQISGRVIKGEQRGRQIGFPTANIALKRSKSAISGVFAVEVIGAAEKIVFGVANVGCRPTVGGEKLLLEVHLFDFSNDIYGKRLQVNLLHKIRDEQCFSSFAALQAQIALDVEVAMEYLRSPTLHLHSTNIIDKETTMSL